MKKSLAAIAVSLVMITGLAPAAHAGPGNSDFGHAQQSEAHERRDARHDERNNRPSEPETPQEPQTPDTPVTPDSPQEPQTPDTPDAPGTPSTPEATTSGASSAQGLSPDRLRGLAPINGTSTPFTKQFNASSTPVIFLNAPTVVRQKDRMALNAYCVLDGKKAAGEQVSFTIQRMSKGKNPRPVGKPRTLGSRVLDNGEAQLSYRILSQGKSKLAPGRYVVSVMMEMSDGSVETAAKELRVTKTKKR